MFLAAPFLLLLLCCSPLGPDLAAGDEEEYGEEIVLSLALEEDNQMDLDKETRPGVFYWSNKDTWRMTGQYIVVLKENVPKSQIERVIRRLQTRAAKRGYLTQVGHVFRELFRGFTVKMSSDMLEMNTNYYVTEVQASETHSMICNCLFLDEELLCRTVWSKASGFARSATAAAQCSENEEMFSCSSFSRNGKRRGEHIEDHRGKKTCIAHNAFGGDGVYAIARCCIWPKAECHTNSSSPGEGGTLSTASCSREDHILTGCSSHSLSGHFSDFVRPVHGTENKDPLCVGKSDMTSHASCCHAPSIECKVKEYSPVGFTDKVTVSCDVGWTLTGCNAYSRSSKALGTYSIDNTCVVSNRQGGKGAAAIAICCQNKHTENKQNSNYR
ncbi:proprotein convertase subtilisin/kexin type 9 [Ascaphus truei]|uniref:proprotein convertase subtilisin/kexin type 9 n=1 Tax=Ascaphus truei TaxID=8439 RepID=UPI003F5AC655